MPLTFVPGKTKEHVSRSTAYSPLTPVLEERFRVGHSLPEDMKVSGIVFPKSCTINGFCDKILPPLVKIMKDRASSEHSHYKEPCNEYGPVAPVEFPIPDIFEGGTLTIGSDSDAHFGIAVIPEKKQGTSIEYHTPPLRGDSLYSAASVAALLLTVPEAVLARVIVARPLVIINHHFISTEDTKNGPTSALQYILQRDPISNIVNASKVNTGHEYSEEGLNLLKKTIATASEVFFILEGSTPQPSSSKVRKINL